MVLLNDNPGCEHSAYGVVVMLSVAVSCQPVKAAG